MLGSRLNVSSACLAGGDLTTGVKADAKARAKAEVDASCRDKDPGSGLGTADALVGEVPFESAGIFGWQCF